MFLGVPELCSLSYWIYTHINGAYLPGGTRVHTVHTLQSRHSGGAENPSGIANRGGPILDMKGDYSSGAEKL